MKKRNRTGHCRRLLACVCAAGILTGAAAGNVYAQEQDTGGGAAMGRYLESEIELPVNDGSLVVLDIVRLADGRLRLAGSAAEVGVALWDSSDGGDTWELAASLPTEYGTEYFTNAVLCADGGGTGIVMHHGTEWRSDDGSDTEGSGDSGASGAQGADEYTFHFVSFDSEGNATHTPCSISDMADLQFSRNGDLLWKTPGGEVYLADRENGEALQGMGSDANTTGICQDEALLLQKSGLQRYDLSTGEPLARDDVLEEMLYADGETYEQKSSSGYPIVFTEDEEGRLYYCNSKGIFSHVMDGSVVEQIVDGSLNSLSDLGGNIVALEIVDQSFFVVYTGDMGQRGLLRYEYDPDIATVPEKELTVYSLQEDEGIRQMAVLFQKEYPDTFVNYQIGMSGTDGVTASDALRTLNTEILAGNGPDILILDGMSVKTYCEKGVLEDLSGILAEVQDTEGLLENIAYTYQESEMVPAAPVRFGIPMAVGESALIERLEDLTSLAEVQQEEVLSMSNIVCLPNILYNSCAAGWTNEDGTMDQEGLAEFIHVMNQIYSEFWENLSEEEKEMVSYFREDMWSARQGYGADTANISYHTLDLLFPNFTKDRSRLCVGTLMDIDDYSGISSVRRELEDCEMRTYGGQLSDTFRPICTVGILKTAREPERAADFIRYLLSRDGEVSNTGDGFPVNTQAFESVLYDAKWGVEDGISIGWGSYDGSEDYSLTYSWPTQEELEWLEETAKQLTVCADAQGVQQQTVLEQLSRCQDGEISEEEAVNSIMQSINLYLAE